MHPFLRETSSFLRVLVAEDPFVSSFLRNMLQRHGHEVLTAGAVHASQMLNEGGVRPQLVITNSPEAFLPLASTLPILYIAANPDFELAARFSICRVLQKPFRNVDLLEAVELLGRSIVP